MELWLTETHTAGYSVNWRVKETLFTGESKYQKISVVETTDFGRALLLDGIVQTTVKDEFIYHEMLTHIPMLTHPAPRKVLVIGGGDGGTVREVLKHSTVEKVVLVEIDEEVIRVSKEYFPEISCGLKDSRVEIIVDDGIEYVKRAKAEFDVILIDSSDPEGPALKLFSQGFYRNVYEALKEDGIMAAQTESPIFNRELLREVQQNISEIFPVSGTYLTAVPTYISGFWTFTLGSKKWDPLTVEIDTSRVEGLKAKYYNTDTHRAAFVLPEFIKNLFR